MKEDYIKGIKKFLKEAWCVDKEEVEMAQVTVIKESNETIVGYMFTLNDSERGQIQVTLTTKNHEYQNKVQGND